MFKFSAFAAPILLLLTACTTGSDSSFNTIIVPGGEKKFTAIEFYFPEGSTCQVKTDKGTYVQDVIPGGIRYATVNNNNAPASCRTPDGSVYDVTAHHVIPADAKGGVAQVDFDGTALVLIHPAAGDLRQTTLSGTVKKR